MLSFNFVKVQLTGKGNMKKMCGSGGMMCWFYKYFIVSFSWRKGVWDKNSPVMIASSCRKDRGYSFKSMATKFCTEKKKTGNMEEKLEFPFVS